MNLNELNGSGKNLRVFLTTAAIALLTTGASWFLLEEFNNYLRWRNASARDKEQFSTLGRRIGMLVYMQRQGYTNMLWKDGFWWRLLISSDSRVMEPVRARGINV